jgi:pyruvate dehydrogenase E2 component (dihydrolipoamide acetyltransferase)
VSGIKGETEVLEPDRAERAIARRAAEARATVPDLELSAEVDISACLSLPQSLTAILVRACALALREAPRANASYRDGRYELYSRINVGVTIATEELLAIPTMFDADQKALSELDQEIEVLTERARADTLSAPELTGATFTLSGPAERSVARASAVIIPPQAAAVAAGAVRPSPVVRDGAVVAGHLMTLTLVCDHRILFGVQAARFLSRIEQLLEEANL